jgi:hypothetical protein
MPRKSFTPEQVIAKLRHIEVALANGMYSANFRYE